MFFTENEPSEIKVEKVFHYTILLLVKIENGSHNAKHHTRVEHIQSVCAASFEHPICLYLSIHLGTVQNTTQRGKDNFKVRKMANC